MTSPGSTLEATVGQYVEVWNTPDPDVRRRVMAASCTPDVRYTDPQYDVSGYAELEALVSGFGSRFPGHQFRLSSAIDQHHGRARWSWEMLGPDGDTVVVSGADFGILAEDNRLREIVGFYTIPGSTRT